MTLLGPARHPRLTAAGERPRTVDHRAVEHRAVDHRTVERRAEVPGLAGGAAGGPPSRPPNIADVARLAGVSAGTVSNVLNNPQRVAPATRQRVRDVMLATGFVPSRAARQLTGAPSLTVGCVLPDLADPACADAARGLEDGLAEAGCLAVTCSSDRDAGREGRSVRLLLEAGVRAVVLDPAGAGPGTVARLLDRGVPVVLLDPLRPEPGLCSVSSDRVSAGRLAAGHLLELGHRRIAVPADDSPVLRDRLAGAVQAVTAHGLDPAAVLTVFDPGRRQRGGDPEAVVERAMAGRSPCTAVLCPDDLAALGVLKVLSDRGVDVPGEVSVVGYGDLPFAALLSPALTTVRQESYRLGRAAARMVVAEAARGHVHRQAVLAPVLVPRASSAAPGR